MYVFNSVIPSDINMIIKTVVIRTVDMAVVLLLTHYEMLERLGTAI